MEPITIGLGFITAAAGIAKGISKYKEGQSSANADRYRASLAQENAQRADILGIEREFRAKNEGILDAGRYRMQATQSGLSGVSKDLWVGQRYMDVYRDVSNARVTRHQTVSRFLKESDWLQQNADAVESSFLWSVFGTALETAANIYKAGA